MTASEHWATSLQQWGIPQHILDAAPQSPWIHPVANFRPTGDLFVNTPSRLRALEALQGDSPSVLDVGCGGGKAAFGLTPPATSVFGVDHQQVMLDVFADEAGARGVQVGTLQHVLEGYKVADEIAHHGAGASCFSDWWAYKFEVIDAIPYNGALMHEAGVVVSFNSDDAELARRLNLEAAKAVKYGGCTPEEALKFVTLNPAKQLRIDSRVGSLEPGKDGDFVIWSGDPLSSFSLAESTWIEGACMFDRAQATAMRARDQATRAKLLELAVTEHRQPRRCGHHYAHTEVFVVATEL